MKLLSYCLIVLVTTSAFAVPVPVGEGCCAPGTTFNQKYSICVPNATNGKAYFIGSKTMEATSQCTGNTSMYSSDELKCVAPSESFITINGTVQPYEPTEIVEYTPYK